VTDQSSGPLRTGDGDSIFFVFVGFGGGEVLCEGTRTKQTQATECSFLRYGMSLIWLLDTFCSWVFLHSNCSVGSVGWGSFVTLVANLLFLC